MDDATLSALARDYFQMTEEARAAKSAAADAQLAAKHAEIEARDIRDNLAEAMAEEGVQEIHVPGLGLVSSRRGPQSLRILDEEQVPAEYWRQKPAPAPTVDKRALLEDLKVGKTVAGVTLANGAPTIAVKEFA